MATIVVIISLLLYGLIHSLLAGSRAKNFIRQQYGDRAYYGLYRIGYNVFALISIAPVVALVMFYSGDTFWNVDSGWQALIQILRVVGVVGIGISLLQIDGQRFLGVRQFKAYLNKDPLPLPDEPLQTGGIYRIVRHPLYLFSLMVIWSMTSMSEAYFGFCIGATIYFVVGSLVEERRLAQAFGDEYKNYQRQTAWLIPFLHIYYKF
jgi:protein-S-isoprenylcysteine O-methyltransferase Ste14